MLLRRSGSAASAVVRGVSGGSVLRGAPRLLTRLLLLACSASLLSLLFIGRCGFKPEDGTGDSNEDSTPLSGGGGPDDLPLELPFEQSEDLRAEVERLNAQVRALKGQLLRAKRWRKGGQEERRGDVGEPLLSRHPASLSDRSSAFNSSGDPGDGPLIETECEAVAADNARRSEAWPGASAWVQAGEYEILPFAHFSLSRLHPPELGLGRRVVEKPVGFRRKDLLEAALAALRLLNASPTLRRLSLEDFLEGVYRTEPTSGTHYELFFRVSRGLSPPPVARVTLVRPFAPLRPTGAPEVRSQRPLVHVVLPLPYNCPHSVFESFMDKFARIAIRNDRKVTLTVAHFGGGGVGLAAARRVMVRVSKDTRFRGMRLLALNTTTSRTAALHAAVEACCTVQPPNNSPVENSVVQKHSDPLLFLADVDAVFSARFLDRCRWHASPGKKVYYPIAFGLYNPKLVYSLQGRPTPPEADRLLVSRDTGSWRDSLFSLSCQYRSDFLRESEAESPDGGPAEDVALYRRHVKSSSVRVVRATDPGLFLLWRRRPCPSAPPNATPAAIERVRACRRARAITEGSHAQLGLLAFRDGDKESESEKKEGTTSGGDKAKAGGTEGTAKEGGGRGAGADSKGNGADSVGTGADSKGAAAKEETR